MVIKVSKLKLNEYGWEINISAQGHKVKIGRIFMKLKDYHPKYISTLPGMKGVKKKKMYSYELDIGLIKKMDPSIDTGLLQAETRSSYSADSIFHKYNLFSITVADIVKILNIIFERGNKKIQFA